MSKALSHLQKNLLQIVRDSLLPWAQAAGEKRIVLAEPPLNVPSCVAVKECAVAPLSETGRGISGSGMKSWPKHRLIATSAPALAFILEGEADFWIGATSRMAKEQNRNDLRGRYVLSLPSQTLCITPPRVPHNTGEPHWERANPERAYSRILQMHIRPDRVLFHTCTTRGKMHTADPVLFVYDPQMAAINDLLIEELRKREKNFEGIANSHLMALLWRVERKLSTESAMAANEYSDGELSASSDSPMTESTTVLQRACRYIETHLDQALSPAGIARSAYVSPSHLNRIFRAELQMSVMDYVTQCRAQAAKSLLATTNLAISDIGAWVGHQAPSHFTRSFRRWTQMSPLEFRRQHRDR